VLDLAIARGRSTALLEPPLHELAPEPPRELMRATVLASLDWFAADSPDSPDTALNAARSWLWAETGQWATKREAAEWARSRAPEPELIDAALALRREGRSAGLDPGAVRGLAGRARDALGRA
jgi:Domain of unknown function (DUF4111)